MKKIYGVQARYEDYIFCEQCEEVLFVSFDYELCERVADKLEKKYQKVLEWFISKIDELSPEELDEYLYKNYKLSYNNMYNGVEFIVFESLLISEEQELIELNLI